MEAFKNLFSSNAYQSEKNVNKKERQGKNDEEALVGAQNYASAGQDTFFSGQDFAGLSDASSVSWATVLTSTLIAATMLTTLVIAGYSLGYIQDHKDDIQNGVPCDPNTVFQYSLTQRFPDASRSDWRTQSHDLYSSSHNGHISNLKSNIRNAVGFCPGIIDHVNATIGGVGVTVTPTIDSGHNVMWFSDHGISGSHLNVTIYAYNLADCSLRWSARLYDLTSKVVNPTGFGNDPDGIDNPFADVYSSMQITDLKVNVNFPVRILVFGDMGTSKYYNNSMCDSVNCGARVFFLNPLSGALNRRFLVRETTPSVTNYTRQADSIPSSPRLYRDVVYVGTSSNQSFTVVEDGLLNFYGVLAGIDINRGSGLLFANSILSADRLADGNLGVGIEGTPPVDVDSDLIIYGTTYDLNQSSDITTCLTTNPHFACTDDTNNNALLSYNTDNAVTEMDMSRPQWRYSPYGADAWTAGCLTGTASPCPVEAGPYYGYFAGSTIIQNECGQRYVISVGQSGTLYSNDVTTGARKWSTYLGPSSNQTATYGMSFDGWSIWLTLGNLDKKSYLTLDGTKRCDSMWVKVNAWTGEIDNIIPVPCSRASSECGVIVPDPFLEVYYTADILDFSNRGTEKAGAAVYCPTTAVGDLRQGEFGATAVGPVITTTDLMFAGSYSGHMHAYDLNGNYVTSLSQCETGIVWGGASISKLTNGRTLLSWGCGHGTGNIPATFGDSQVKMLSV